MYHFSMKHTLIYWSGHLVPSLTEKCLHIGYYTIKAFTWWRLWVNINSARTNKPTYITGYICIRWMCLSIGILKWVVNRKNIFQKWNKNAAENQIRQGQPVHHFISSMADFINLRKLPFLKTKIIGTIIRNIAVSTTSLKDITDT